MEELHEEERGGGGGMHNNRKNDAFYTCRREFAIFKSLYFGISEKKIGTGGKMHRTYGALGRWTYCKHKHKIQRTQLLVLRYCAPMLKINCLCRTI